MTDNATPAHLVDTHPQRGAGTSSLEVRQRLAGAWCGPVYVVGVIGGWALLAGYLVPPHSPHWTPTQVAHFYQEHTTSIRIGMVVLMFTALAAVYYSASVTRAIMDIEGGVGFLAITSILGAAALVILTFYPATLYLTAAFRPERPEQLIYLMNDLGWLQLIGGISIFLAQPVAVAIAAFMDRGDPAVFPRWVGYYNIWTILLMLPDQLLFFFHSGPFAWNGLFGLWLPAGVFGLWFLVMAHVMRKDLRRRVDGNTAVPATTTRRCERL